MTMVLQANQIEKSYRQGKSKLEVLKGLQLEVEKGQFISVVGKSGSGKSTLFHILCGLDRPDRGEVIVDGVNLYRLNAQERNCLRRKKIGFVFQFFHLIPELTVRENILFPIYLDKAKTDNAYIDYLAETLELKDRLEHYPDQLSGGQQQRVALARALANKPEIVFCDEPTGNLDEQSSETVMQMLFEVRRELRQTLLLVTHDHEIAALADRRYSLYGGLLHES